MRALKFAALGVWTATQAAAFTAPDSLTVVLFNFAEAPRTVLLSAAREGRRAFRAAGVETTWILCSPTEGCYVPERFVPVKLLSRAIKSTPISSRGLASTVSCTGAERCAASYVFYDRVLAFADDTSSPTDIALGYIMAHEIGHFMGLGHRPEGIMKADFNSRDLHHAAAGWLRFDEADARELRAAAARVRGDGDPSHRIKLAAWRGDAAE